jgi:hypothetical protein
MFSLKKINLKTIKRELKKIKGKKKLTTIQMKNLS